MNTDLSTDLRSAQAATPRQQADYAVRRAEEDSAQTPQAPENVRPAAPPADQGRFVDKSV